tara:strand:- start:149 stop:625 length:477 start_codon:yes stop_codon:yes gene_type:complete
MSVQANKKVFFTLGSTVNVNSPDGSSIDMAFNRILNNRNSYSIGLHPSAYSESHNATKNVSFNISLSGEYQTQNLLIRDVNTGFGIVATAITGDKDSKTLNNSYAGKLYISSTVPIGTDCFGTNTLGISTSRKQPKDSARIDTNKFGAPTLGVSCILK